MNRLRSLAAALLLAGAGVAHADELQTVAPDELASFIAAQKGLLAVSLSSRDSNCGYCVQHNPRFRLLARNSRDGGRFAQVLWEPWGRIPEPVRALMTAHGVNGVPAVLVFQDGVFVSKQVGAIAQPAPAPPAPETGHVPQLLPADAMATLAASTGTVVVMLSSFETPCAFCLRANPAFEDFAQATPGVRFLRVMYRPWTAVGQEAFGRSVDAAGLPAYVTYRDGRPVRRHVGFAANDELRKLLLDGLD